MSERNGLTLDQAQDPFALFSKWMEDAKLSELNDPNAMSLATCTPDGAPSVRIVLCKGYQPEGFRFYTNSESRKGEELAHNQRVALAFHWKSRQRQVRVEGAAQQVSKEDADAYFKRRHRMSQIGAWASQQSQPLASREALLASTQAIEERFPEPQEIPRPDYWNGYLVVPTSIEFWQEGDYRLHDRFVFTHTESAWQKQRLNP